MLHGGDLGRIDSARLVAAQDQQRHIAGDDAHDEEHESGDAEQRGNDQQQPLGDVRAHGAVTSCSHSSASQTSCSFWFV